MDGVTYQMLLLYVTGPFRLAVFFGITVSLMPTKKPTRRSRGKYLKGSMDVEVATSTLADNDVISDIVGDTPTEKVRCSSIEATYSISGTAGDGPLIIGVAHSDYTDAEIEETLENAGSWSLGDKVSQERAKRLVREIGTFDGLATEEVLNDGKPIKTRLNWSLISGQALRFWVWNKSGSALQATLLNVQGHANLWVT